VLKVEIRKLSVKFLALAMLLGCLVFIALPTTARVPAPDCPACNDCDSTYVACRDNATTGDEVVGCQDNYSACLNDCGYYDIDGCEDFGTKPRPLPYLP
jgi:hypothetical protein